MTVKRDVMSIVKRSLSWPRKLKSRTISSARWLSLMYDGKVLTIEVINVLKSTLQFLSIPFSNCYDSFNFNGVRWLFDAKLNLASSNMWLRANYPKVLLHLSSITNEDHLSLRKDNFLVCYCRDFESHKKFVKTLTSVKPCNSCHFNKKIHEHLLRSLINSHFIDGFSWTLNGLSTWTTWLLEYNYHEIQILVSRCCLVLLQKVEFLSSETTHFIPKKKMFTVVHLVISL